MNINGSTAFVTGANRGIGLALVRELRARGATTVYAAVRVPDAVASMPGVVPVQLDVTDHDRATALAQELTEVDLVVNNAGIGLASPALGEDALRAALAEFQVNTLGPLAVSRAFAPVLRANGGGAIVNILSVLSFLAVPDLATYAASKAAAWSLTNALRIELASQGTTVVGVHPGYVDTDLAAGVDAPKLAPGVVAAAALDAVEAGTVEVLVGQAVFGIGLGLVVASSTAAAMTSVAAAQAPMASGLVNTFRQVGAVLGTSVLGTILASQTAASLPESLAQHGVHGPGQRAVLLAAAHGSLQPTALATPVRAAVDDALTSGLHTGLAVNAVVFLAGAVFASAVVRHRHHAEA
ncbi:SDR family NAD(P)-dependent oxidoreductase [Pedococcus sp. 5OH_020]|uniref:SDR family NAD(P)-dependent oxidoreductase n=1 Tax=Pedococcus sp. 5OH_020 TaxID=2989814 RepID=UPI0022E9A3FE|nr:SDR family NAD(P)-dependent oxidoreductase [Pedococcus sp. 5OH_020]